MTETDEWWPCPFCGCTDPTKVDWAYLQTTRTPVKTNAEQADVITGNGRVRTGLVKCEDCNRIDRVAVPT